MVAALSKRSNGRVKRCTMSEVDAQKNGRYLSREVGERLALITYLSRRSAPGRNP